MSGDPQNEAEASNQPQETAKNERWKLWVFLMCLAADAIFSVLILAPIVKALVPALGETSASHYTVYGCLYDLSILATLRLVTSCWGLSVAHVTGYDPPEFPFATHHPNGDKKSREGRLRLQLARKPLESDNSPFSSCRPFVPRCHCLIC